MIYNNKVSFHRKDVLCHRGEEFPLSSYELKTLFVIGCG